MQLLYCDICCVCVVIGVMRSSPGARSGAFMTATAMTVSSATNIIIVLWGAPTGVAPFIIKISGITTGPTVTMVTTPFISTILTIGFTSWYGFTYSNVIVEKKVDKIATFHANPEKIRNEINDVVFCYETIANFNINF